MSESERAELVAYITQNDLDRLRADKWATATVAAYPHEGGNVRLYFIDGKAQPAPDDAAIQAARADAADFILGLLVVAKHITHKQASQARDIARDVGKYPPTAVDAAMSAGGKQP